MILTRQLIKQGCEVKVVMTEASTHFVSPLSFSALSKNAVSINLIDNETWSNHVDLGLWADAMIVAPATATTLSKMASGQSDNMLVATYLSAKCPVYIAPAMDLDMWIHPATVSNIQKLSSYGNIIIPIGHGELASGLVGDGRMAEPEDIIKYLADTIRSEGDLNEKNIIITAGPTFESIDPVRYIGNHSTGLMGICLAEECRARGAKVKLILGPTHLSPKDGNIEVVNVRSAEEMHDQVMKDFEKSDVVILAAAVADYRSKTIAAEKIKKANGDMTLELTRTIDIAQALGRIKSKKQITIGFALETTEELNNAKKKLLKKNFDFIVLNSLKDEGAGFAHNTNKVSVVHKDDTVNVYELKSKKAVAKDIIDELVSIMSK